MHGDLALLAQIEFLVFDFDGVFTDNKVLVGQDGHEYVFCSRADGLGVEMLTRAGIATMILSAERNAIVKARADKLRIECVYGCTDKWAELQRVLAGRGISASSVAYVGNDVNDSECLRQVGIPICVADAHPAVKELAKLVTTRPGGNGAVREICDLVIQAHRRQPAHP